MKVTVEHINSGIPKKNFKYYDEFIKYLQKKFPLENDVVIYFLGERIGHMTTGSRTPKHQLKILSKHRINRDILRTLVHEWVHEYEHMVMEYPKGPNIGGRNENIANIESGIIMKKFEKDYPDLEDWMYQ